MSLVSIKNMLLGQPGRKGPGSTASDDTISDPERQPLLSSPKLDNDTEDFPSTKAFKIDARIISDATIGLSDGLTVPFALTAGLSALGQTKVVIYGGLAELIAGAISMGLGGYLGAKSEAASYRETRKECEKQVDLDPTGAAADTVRDVFASYDLPPHILDDLSRHLARSPESQVDFLMRFGHCIQEPASNRAAISALTIAAGYFFGGLLPLMPYFFVSSVDLALWISIGVMAVALFVFGYAKTCAVTGWSGRQRVFEGIVGGAEMVVVGGAAAGAAMGLVKLFDGIANQ
ncbi:CCC1 protein [Plectosphaerella plurivora]|uniref:CCC1 protein n=1 Tax=Plectosphaerella plurivora TaxID=936078 RepID=A0A9P8V7M9_9PEZI|nr:CCC1 protein [Plectosphaerella plurivora]